MLNSVIRFALRNRLLIVCLALAVIVLGSYITTTLPIDVLPDLTRPRVTLLTEAHGMAPEEVEQLVTIPLENAVHGATDVIAVRSSSGIGLSVIYVEFDWGTDIYTARQIVQERLEAAKSDLPEGIQPQMTPISSLLGQIMLVGMWSETGKTKPMELRTLADWNVAQQLRTINGVSQVITMGGDLKQYQVLVDVHQIHKYEVSIADIEKSLRESNLNVTGGYLDSGSQELLVRGLGRIQRIDQLKKVVVKPLPGRSLTLEQVADVREGAAIKRGDSYVNGRSAVVLTIQKQPGADTRRVTEDVIQAVKNLETSLPSDVVIDPTLYQQRQFIDYGVGNVTEALVIGAVLVVLVLLVFLLNFRTTLITLTAIPLSVLVTSLVFWWFEMSINVMTLGGIAVALGELVDDAIVDVENILRRLKLNAQSPNPRSPLRVIFEASREVRGAIVISTVLVVVVFAPLFALSGMEGRLFRPLGVAYIVAILASTLVSLTVTPVLSYYLLPKARGTQREGDGPVLQGLKKLITPVIRFSMQPGGITMILAGVFVAVIWSIATVSWMGKDFLPPFDEGAAQLNLIARTGTSLETSRQISHETDKKLRRLLKSDKNPDGPLLNFTARIGRAEKDEHVMGVNITEYVIALNPDSGLTRQEVIEKLHEAVDDIVGVQHEVEQPMAHLISHMLSGVEAQIAVKLYGDNLDTLRVKAKEIEGSLQGMDGIAEPILEQQALIPQLRIELNHDQLAFHGINATFVQNFVETAMNGKVVSQIVEEQRKFDLLVRMDEPYRRDIPNLHRMPLDLPSGARIPLSDVAEVYEAGGPNTIKRDNARRRVVVKVNTVGRDLSSAVAEIRRRIESDVELPDGYYVEYAGQFEAQQTATRRILLLSLVALAVVFVVLYSAFPSTRLVLQILIALPIAFVGGVAALILTGQNMSVAAMVGFVSLGGIAARNGLLLMQTYLDNMRDEGLSREMILSGSLDRLAPVLMTALTTGIGLVPLIVGGQLPGREILYPVATVIVGGLITSTMCEFLVRPGLFWVFSGSAPQRLVDAEAPLGEEGFDTEKLPLERA